MMYAIHIVILLLLVVSVGRKQPDRWLFFVAYFLKVSAGIALGLIFMYHYKAGDTLKYFELASGLVSDSAGFTKALGRPDLGGFENQPRAILFTKIVSVILFITKGDYWVVSAYLSTISFFAYWFFYRQIHATLPNIKWPVALGFLLFPSAVFWSAGIMKGALTNAAVVFLAAFALKLFYRKKIYITEIVLALLGVLTLYFIKYYLLIVLLPALIYALFDRRAYKWGLNKGLKASVYVIIIMGTLLVGPLINPNLRISKLPNVISENQQIIKARIHNQSIIDLTTEPTWGSLLAESPKALFIGLFGPTIFDKGSVWSWFPKIENTFILAFTIFSIVLVFKNRLFDPDILLVACIIFIFVLAIFLSLAAPNFGALSRYKAPITPFLVTCVTILPYWFYRDRWMNNH